MNHNHTLNILQDINKLLDDTPKYSDFCSASNSPSLLSPPKITEISSEELPLAAITEPSSPAICVQKITSAAINVNPVRPYKPKVFMFVPVLEFSLSYSAIC